jgi:hypothetical protein
MSPTALKARQASKIAEIGAALHTAGICSLPEQVMALGLPRSTTYTIMRAEHKSTGCCAHRGCHLPFVLQSKNMPEKRPLASMATTRGNNGVFCRGWTPIAPLAQPEGRTNLCICGCHRLQPRTRRRENHDDRLRRRMVL